MKKQFKYLLLVVAAMFGLSSCVDDLNTTPIDPNVVMTFHQDEVFTKIYATLALTGQKAPDGDGDVDGIDEGASAFYRMTWELNEFPTDEGWWVWGDAGIPQVREISWNSSNSLIAGVYYRLYFDITLCNLFLDKATGSDDKTQKQRAEVRFIRALNYYYLLDMFGSVPFVTTVSLEHPAQITRKNLYEWLVGELKDLDGSLYADGSKSGYYRVDQVSAWLLLSRLYLNAEVYAGTADWDNAALYASKVMKSSYELAPVYKHLFMGDNDNLSTVNQAYKEIIFPISQDGEMTRSWGGSRFLVNGMRDAGMNPSGSDDSWSCFRSSPTLVEKFFPTGASSIKGDENSLPILANDDRALLCNQVIVQSSTGTDSVSYSTNFGGGMSSEFNACWSIAKFSGIYVSGAVGTNASFVDTDIPFFRVSEAYLTYAEAVFRGGQVVDKTALDAVNDIRRRAHATLWTGADLTEMNLLDEWSREFYAEGRRRIDLIRFNKFGGNANYNWEGKGGTSAGKNVDAKYNLFPIPEADVVANHNLEQNPDYQ
jgi:hypothetical protein